MKHFNLIILLAILSNLSSVAQPYESIFGKDSTRWSYFTDYGGADYLATIFFYTNTDTLINAKSYKILDYKFEMMDPVLTRFGYLREDTILGKVWFLPLESEKEILFMDISLNVGDTFIFEMPSVICSIRAVKSVSFQNQLKTVEFSDYSFIEGTGSTDGFFNFAKYGCGAYSEFLCAHKDGIQIYGASGDCYKPRWGSFESANSHLVKISPNPVHGNLTIDFENLNGEKEISLIDICGRILKTYKTDLAKLEINLSVFHNGLYYLKINNKIVQKIIINGY
jgi:hypothetical protein